MSEPSSKRQKTHPAYELIYWPSIPGRGEYIRLLFEATSTPYTDVGNASSSGIKAVQSLIDPKASTDEAGNPPAFAPPALKVPGAGRNGGDLLITQTPNILAYLGEKVGLNGEDEASKWHVQEIALTALDLGNEAHDTHHPVAVMDYYEDQKPEALKKATDFRKNRIPKFFAYFERILQGNKEQGEGKYLVGKQLSYADTTVWQVVDGLSFAFPKEIEARKEEFPLLLGTFYPGVKEEESIKEYLSSSRRQKYSNGIFRQYPELDRE